MALSHVEWLQRWLLAQCDGDWEHGDGITIQSLDNPAGPSSSRFEALCWRAGRSMK